MGDTGADEVALGVPDYRFVNDVGLGYGGTNTDVFDVGESVVLAFPTSLHNVAGEPDLILSAFVGGAGATDNASVMIEASSDGVHFAVIGMLDTEDGRDPMVYPLVQEIDYEGVKHFPIDFGTEDLVTHVRLSNVGGTAEGLRLDALEGLHPEVGSAYAFEVRFDRYQMDSNNNFFVRIKNIASDGGVAIREFRMTRSTAPGATLEETTEKLFTTINKQGLGVAGESFVCVENCIPNAGPLIPFSRHAWSLDGSTEAPAGLGLEPGHQAINQRSTPFDVDNNDYLSGMSFRVTFADGSTHDFDYDNDVLQQLGRLYQQYPYYVDPPDEAIDRPTDYYQGMGSTPAPIPVPSSSPITRWLLLLALASISIGAVRSIRAARSADRESD